MTIFEYFTGFIIVNSLYYRQISIHIAGKRDYVFLYGPRDTTLWTRPGKHAAHALCRIVWSYMSSSKILPTSQFDLLWVRLSKNLAIHAAVIQSSEQPTIIIRSIWILLLTNINRSTIDKEVGLTIVMVFKQHALSSCWKCWYVI